MDPNSANFRDEDKLLAREQEDERSLYTAMMTPLDAEEGGSWHDEETSPLEDPDRLAR